MSSLAPTISFGQARDGHDGVGGDALVAGLERQARPVGVVAGLPEPVALAGVGRPLEAAGRRSSVAISSAGGGLLGDGCRGAVEFEQQRRRGA